MDAEAEREFREFVAARSAALFRSAYLLTGQREAAEDLPESEVAAVLDVAVGTVRSTAFRALARLRASCPELAVPEEAQR